MFLFHYKRCNTPHYVNDEPTPPELHGERHLHSKQWWLIMTCVVMLSSRDITRIREKQITRVPDNEITRWRKYKICAKILQNKMLSRVIRNAR